MYSSLIEYITLRHGVVAVCGGGCAFKMGSTGLVVAPLSLNDSLKKNY
jgi:hypothetical protein